MINSRLVRNGIVRSVAVQLKNNMKIEKELVSKAVGQIGYDIIDNIISPICGVSGVFADLYLADISIYTDSEEQGQEVIKAIYERYKMPIDEVIDVETNKSSYRFSVQDSWPIALIVLLILEEGEYDLK